MQLKVLVTQREQMSNKLGAFKKNTMNKISLADNNVRDVLSKTDKYINQTSCSCENTKSV